MDTKHKLQNLDERTRQKPLPQIQLHKTRRKCSNPLRERRHLQRLTLMWKKDRIWYL